jgi:uncharacterized protein YoxC
LKVLRTQREELLAALKQLDVDISTRVEELTQDAKEAADLAEAEARVAALKKAREEALLKKQQQQK